MLKMDGAGCLLGDLASVRQELVEAYLSAWHEYGSVATLSEEFEVAQSLAPVHVALKFARLLEYGFDSKWDLAGAVPAYLRMAM